MQLSLPDTSVAAPLNFSYLCFSVHLRQPRSVGTLCHSADDLHPTAVQRGLTDYHLPLQELCGLQGRKEW